MGPELPACVMPPGLGMVSVPFRVALKVPVKAAPGMIAVSALEGPLFPVGLVKAVSLVAPMAPEFRVQVSFAKVAVPPERIPVAILVPVPSGQLTSQAL